MRRRRIREIVAASLVDWAGEPVTAAEITITARGPLPRSRAVEIGVIWAAFARASKREAMQAALYAHGWSRAWPVLTPVERVRNRADYGLDALWSDSPSVRLEHLREPVALPEEARRG